ncbi:MAG TPA: hypothetical protein VK184_25625 [Nostocaceae cyanobacterium]|nr:hypothetical protein [Nostocaceae cyanobacterium]
MGQRLLFALHCCARVITVPLGKKSISRLPAKYLGLGFWSKASAVAPPHNDDYKLTFDFPYLSLVANHEKTAETAETVVDNHTDLVEFRLWYSHCAPGHSSECGGWGHFKDGGRGAESYSAAGVY